MDQAHVRVNFDLDITKHKKFKSICILSGKNMKEVLTELIDVFVDAIESSDKK